jgi:uncharacterized protein YecE (DUF72 family)
LVYSAADGINYLEEYARRYDTVEVDRWFWSLFEKGGPRLPRTADVAEYCQCVGPDFRFTVKAPNSITLTHYHAKSKSDPLIPNPHFLDPDLFIQFLFHLDHMAGVLGPIIFQFGYLNRQHISGQGEFLKRLGDFFDAVPMGLETALEIRNPKWLNAAHFEFIASRDLVPVLLQGYWMPPVTEVYREWHHLIDQCGTVAIRLHGPDREEMEKETGKRWDTLVVRRDEELAGIVAMIEELLAAGVDVYLAINNHYEGCAPLTIQRIGALLGGGQSTV